MSFYHKGQRVSTTLVIYFIPHKSPVVPRKIQLICTPECSDGVRCKERSNGRPVVVLKESRPRDVQTCLLSSVWKDP